MTRHLHADTRASPRRAPVRATQEPTTAREGTGRGATRTGHPTYRALVRAVLERENARKRERVRERLRADGSVPYADAMTEVLFDILADERFVRLWTWSQLHGWDDETPPDSPTDLSRLVDAIEEGVHSVLPPPEGPDRARIERVVLLAMSGAYGYALGRRYWLTSLGHDPDEHGHDAACRTALSSVLAAHLAGSTP